MLDLIPDKPALKLEIEYKKTIVIADTHFGFEYALEGIRLPSQTANLAYKLLSICKETNAKKLIHLGDVKHEVRLVSYKMRKELSIFFDILSEYVNEIVICTGNHDANLKKYLPNWVELQPSRGFKIGNIAFFHGHSWPSEDVMNADCVVSAHIHPALLLADKLGMRSVLPCWLKTKFKPKETKARYRNFGSPTLIIMPAFNNFCGSPINTHQNEKLLGPLFRNKLVDMNNAEIYLLNGMFVSAFKDVMQIAQADVIQTT